MKHTPRKSAVLLAFALAVYTAGTFSCSMASAEKLLHGSASETETRRNNLDDDGGPSLSRRDIKENGGDPFGAPEENQTIDAPSSAFKGNSIAPPKQAKKKFPLGADKDDFMGIPGTPIGSGPKLRGQPAQPDQEQQPMPQLTEAPPQLPPQQINQDPDMSPEMQLAWDMWHKRVAGAIFERFNFFAKAAFRFCRPTVARVGYTVTRDHQVINVMLVQPSNNIMFNALILQVVKSINGDASILTFPDGSRRTYVEKLGNFMNNMGSDGFRYTTGDRETIRGR